MAALVLIATTIMKQKKLFEMQEIGVKFSKPPISPYRCRVQEKRGIPLQLHLIEIKIYICMIHIIEYSGYGKYYI